LWAAKKVWERRGEESDDSEERPERVSVNCVSVRLCAQSVKPAHRRVSGRAPFTAYSQSKPLHAIRDKKLEKYADPGMVGKHWRRCLCSNVFTNEWIASFPMEWESHALSMGRGLFAAAKNVSCTFDKLS
jgi:hypothetical protein